MPACTAVSCNSYARPSSSERRACGGDDFPGGISPPPHSLQHRLASQATASTCRLRGVMRRMRTTSRHRPLAAPQETDPKSRSRCAGQNRGRTARITGRAGRGQRPVKRLLDQSNSAQARVGTRGHLAALGLAHPITERGQLSGGGRHLLGCGGDLTGPDQIRELALDHGRASPPPRIGVAPSESCCTSSTAADVSPAESTASQRSQRISARLPPRRPAPGRAGWRPPQGPPGPARAVRRNASARPTRAQPPALLVQGPKLPPVGVRLLEMEGDHLLVLATSSPALSCIQSAKRSCRPARASFRRER